MRIPSRKKVIKRIKKSKKIKIIRIKRKYTKKIKIIPTVLVTTNEKKVRKKRKSKTPGVRYFTEDTENFIVLYNQTEDLEKRNQIYNDCIKFPFEKLVENIINTFKFSYFETSLLDAQKETVSHLVGNIHKYEKWKGKAFSYFSIVAKHFLIFLNNTNHKRFNQTVPIGEHDKDETHTVQLQSEDGYHKKNEMSEFLKMIIEYWETNINKIFNKQKDLDIANAVVELLRNNQLISMFNKKSLYLYIREISNCKTSQITKILNKMKFFYDKMRQSYEKDGVISV